MASSCVAVAQHRSRHSLLVLLTLLCFFLLACTVPTLVSAAPSSSSSSLKHRKGKDLHSVMVVSTCPRCPMCSRPGTPLKQRLQYCNRASNFLFSLFSGNKYPKELPFTSDRSIRRDAMRNINELLTHVIGQPHVAGALEDALRKKLSYPKDPLVLHLAGDNGVGKSFTARLISQALSLRCSADRDVCDAGDSLLTISGTSFDRMPLATARRRIVAQISAHQRQYPHGVVLVDDLTAMDPELVHTLAPLFGRASYFPEQLDPDFQEDGEEEEEEQRTTKEKEKEKMATTKEDTSSSSNRKGKSGEGTRATSSSSTHVPPPPLSQLLVVVTTDFGQQGRTVGKSINEIAQMVREEFASLYGALLPAYTRTYVYLPFTQEVAEEVVRVAVANLPCVLGEHVVATSSIDDLAVSFLVERHRETWQSRENGHALRRLIEDELVAQVLVYIEAHGADQRLVSARFVLDETEARVVLKVVEGHSGEVNIAEHEL